MLETTQDEGQWEKKWKKEWEQRFYTFCVKRKSKHDQPGIWVKQKEGDKKMRKPNRRKTKEYMRRTGINSLNHWEGDLVLKKEISIEARNARNKEKGNLTRGGR